MLDNFTKKVVGSSWVIPVRSQVVPSRIWMKLDSIPSSSLEAVQRRIKQRGNDGETKGTTKCNVTNYIVILASCGHCRML